MRFPLLSGRQLSSSTSRRLSKWTGSKASSGLPRLVIRLMQLIERLRASTIIGVRLSALQEFI